MSTRHTTPIATPPVVESPDLVPIPSLESRSWGRWAEIIELLKGSPMKAYRTRSALSKAERRSLRSAATWKGLGIHIQALPDRRNPAYSLVWIKGPSNARKRSRRK